MEKVRLNKKKCQQGLDGMNLELALGLEDMEYCSLPPEELKNDAGNTIVRIECIGGRLRAYANVVHCIRSGNVKPFGIVDMIKLEQVRGQVTDVPTEAFRGPVFGRNDDRKRGGSQCDDALRGWGYSIGSDFLAGLGTG